MENDPSIKSGHVDDTEVLLDVSYKRLISISKDFSLYCGGKDFVDGLSDRATDSYEHLETGSYNSSVKIEFQAQVARDYYSDKDFTHYYIGVEARDEIEYEDLPPKIAEKVRETYLEFVSNNTDFEEEPEYDPTTFECIRVLHTDINYDSNLNFGSWKGVSFEIDGNFFEISDDNEAEYLPDGKPIRDYETKNDVDEYLTKSISDFEISVTVYQIEEAMKFMEMLIDRKYGITD